MGKDPRNGRGVIPNAGRASTPKSSFSLSLESAEENKQRMAILQQAKAVAALGRILQGSFLGWPLQALGGMILHKRHFSGYLAQKFLAALPVLNTYENLLHDDKRSKRSQLSLCLWTLKLAISAQRHLKGLNLIGNQHSTPSIRFSIFLTV